MGERSGEQPGGNGAGREPPVLPDTTADERDAGWGDWRDGADGASRDAEWYRRERPPHHDR